MSCAGVVPAHHVDTDVKHFGRLSGRDGFV
jgi:hypothetical protein